MSEYKCEEFELYEKNIQKLEDTINYKANHGYDYVGFVPMDTGNSGKIYTFGLIFKKNEN